MFYNAKQKDMSSMGNDCANDSSLGKIIIDGNKVLCETLEKFKRQSH